MHLLHLMMSTLLLLQLLVFLVSSSMICFPMTVTLANWCGIAITNFTGSKQFAITSQLQLPYNSYVHLSYPELSTSTVSYSAFQIPSWTTDNQYWMYLLVWFSDVAGMIMLRLISRTNSRSVFCQCKAPGNLRDPSGGEKTFFYDHCKSWWEKRSSHFLVLDISIKLSSRSW